MDDPSLSVCGHCQEILFLLRHWSTYGQVHALLYRLPCSFHDLLLIHPAANGMF